MSLVNKAYEIIGDFRDGDYVFGVECFDRLGDLVSQVGNRAVVVASGFGREWGEKLHCMIRESLAAGGVELLGGLIQGAAENSPFEDVYRICNIITSLNPDVIVSVGGGSNMDAVKAANVHATFGYRYELGDYFGVGKVAQLSQATGKKIRPMVAAQLASASGSHLTKYSNITDTNLNQKLLIIDNAIVPPKALFDYELTRTMPRGLTLDGAFDGLTHCLEVWMGIPDDKASQVEAAALTGIELIVTSLAETVENLDDLAGREKIGLGTDCGAISIMIGGTNGAHLTSFSLVDVMSHGRACALLEPYYLTMFSPAIERRLRPVAEIYAKAGYLKTDTANLHGLDLGLAVAEAMIAMSRSLGFPTTLDEVDKFSDAHVDRILAGAKKPELASKLQNMPVPMDASMVDEYIGSVISAARSGNLGLIKPLR